MRVSERSAIYAAYLQLACAVSFVQKGHLDVHDVLRVGKREFNLAEPSVGDNALCAGPHRLDVINNSVPS